MADLDERAKKLLEEPNFGFLATLMPDGSPQVTPVWVNLDNGRVTFNTAIGRTKERNLRRDQRVAISVADRNDPYEHVDVRGRVVELIEGDEAEAQIDDLSEKYNGVRPYPDRSPGEKRVKVIVEAERVSLE